MKKLKNRKLKNIKPIHPFPARMAPDLVLQKLKKFEQGAIVLDPMAGSGTVLRHASELGHKAIGFDQDPLAVLMSKVWVTPVKDAAIQNLFQQTIQRAKSVSKREIFLPWIDKDVETKNFIDFWFASNQKDDLRRLAFAIFEFKKLHSPDFIKAADVLRIAFSKLIIVKDSGASLARDISHSRPHKVAEQSKFEVFPAFERNVKQLRSLLFKEPPKGKAKVQNGDSRHLRKVRKKSVDVVLTSPPYLNAIDYMRGHKLSLVWLGYSLGELRDIRSNSIGAERAADRKSDAKEILAIQKAMCEAKELPARHKRMISRYAGDLSEMMSEISRVLKPKGRAILVVGNSCLQNNFISNSNGIRKAASQVGLRLLSKSERKLPNSKRYLPITTKKQSALGKRMRTETILTFGFR